MTALWLVGGGAGCVEGWMSRRAGGASEEGAAAGTTGVDGQVVVAQKRWMKLMS